MRTLRRQSDISDVVLAVFRMAEFVLSLQGFREVCHLPGFCSGVAVPSLSVYPVLSTLLTSSRVPRTVYILDRGAVASPQVEYGKGS